MKRDKWGGSSLQFLISFLLPLSPDNQWDTVSGPTSGKFCSPGELWAYLRNQINWTDPQLGRPDWAGDSHVYFTKQNTGIYIFLVETQF